MARRKIETCECPQCNEVKELIEDNFGKDKTRKSGWYRICKVCDATNQRAWRAKRKEQLEEAARIKEEQAAAHAKATVKVTRKRTRATKAAA